VVLWLAKFRAGRWSPTVLSSELCGAAIAERAFPRKEAPPCATLGFGDDDTVVEVPAGAAAAASSYLMGSRFTAADVVIGSGLRRGTAFRMLPQRPEFGPFLASLQARPALQRAIAKDAALAEK